MADPVLRIPVDDAAFKRYVEAFQRYQQALGEQPGMWTNVNEHVLEVANAGDVLLETIQRQVDAVTRLGLVEERNAQRKRKDARDHNDEEQRASRWRQRALESVDQLTRGGNAAARAFSTISGGGGLYGGIGSFGKHLGGDVGAAITLVTDVLSAGYKASKGVSDKGQTAIGIGTNVGQMSGFNNYLGKFTDTQSGLAATANALGDPSQWASFAKLGVKQRPGQSVSDVYADIVRKATDVAKQATDSNGNIRLDYARARGALDFFTPEDLRRLVARDKAGQLTGDINNSLTAQKDNPLNDQSLVQDSTTATQFADNASTLVEDNAQALGARGNNAAMRGVKSAIPAITGSASALSKQLTPAIRGATDAVNKFTGSLVGGKGTHNVSLSGADVVNLKKLVATEWMQGAGQMQGRGIIDTVLNRLASGHWGNSIASVANARGQFSDVNSILTDKKGRHSIDQIPMSRVNKRTSDLVDSWLAARESGAASSVGDNLNYANLEYSSPSNRPWIMKLDGPRYGTGKAVHRHGTTDNLQRYRPGQVSVRVATTAPPGMQTAVSVTSAAGR